MFFLYTGHFGRPTGIPHRSFQFLLPLRCQFQPYLENGDLHFFTQFIKQHKDILLLTRHLQMLEIFHQFVELRFKVLAQMYLDLL